MNNIIKRLKGLYFWDWFLGFASLALITLITMDKFIYDAELKARVIRGFVWIAVLVTVSLLVYSITLLIYRKSKQLIRDYKSGKFQADLKEKINELIDVAINAPRVIFIGIFQTIGSIILLGLIAALIGGMIWFVIALPIYAIVVLLFLILLAILR